MANSSLVTYTNYSPNNYGKRNHEIDTVSIHCMVAQWTGKQCADYFSNKSVGASSNYCVGYDGSIAISVSEDYAAYTSSNMYNDHRAITIEVASDRTYPYAVTDKAYEALIKLLVDICQRHPKIGRLRWKADKSLVGQVDKQNMTVHRWFAAKACPGDYLYNRHTEIANKVNAQLDALEEAKKPTTSAPVVNTPEEEGASDPEIKIGSILEFTGSKQYVSSSARSGVKASQGRVKITNIAKGAKHPYHVRTINDEGNFIGGVYGWVDAADLKAIATTPAPSTPTVSTPEPFKSYVVRITHPALNIRRGPGTKYTKDGTIRDRGLYTIIDEQDGWGKLKSSLSAGYDRWICLDYTKKI